ncbi:hypothetical protein QUF90_05650 [Desulfococcaceae bacterium HSG9]|nr:hypothetical protein [Desulfococcaceae bacterium HSG9]
MNNQTEIEEINRKIVQMKKITLELNQNEIPYPFLKRNTERILASIKMLELNVSDITESL